MDRSENDLNALEARLGAWRPAASALDRDRMMFLAGKASASSEMKGRIAGGAIVGLAVLAVGLGGMWAKERGRRVTLEAIVADQARESPRERIDRVDPAETPASSSYLVLSQSPEVLQDSEVATTASLSPPAQGPMDREPPLSPLSSRGAELTFE